MTRFLEAGYPLLAVLALAVCQPAAAADEEQQAPSDARWSLALGTEVDQQTNRGFEGEVGYALTPNSSVRLAANSVSYYALASNGFSSQGLELGASHNFARWTLDGAVGRWQDTDILTAEELKLGADLPLRPWSIGLRGMLRRSGFEPLGIDTTVTLRDGTQLPVAATSSCTLDNTGLGLHGAFGGEVWGAYLTAMNYQYRDASCSFDTPGLEALHHPDRAEFSQLEATLVDPLETVGVRRIGRENALLASDFDAGTSWKHEDLIVSLDFAHQKEYFSGAHSNTLSATGTADLGDKSGVDLTVGLTRGSTVQSGAFMGLAVRAHF
ncbi:MAG TPA: hypothetical protein VN787_07520 [Steroidobacteraceae bacterium]|nr:hypothetical protein [Steroidobacteraceae bacterium]